MPLRPLIASEVPRVAARYLRLLGIFELIVLNLGGLLFLWFAKRVEQRSARFRTATLYLCWFHVAMGVIGLLWSAGHAFEGGQLAFVGMRLPCPPWLVLLVVPLLIAVSAGPILLLTRPGVKEQFQVGQHCRSCGYDLRASTGNECPECGHRFPAPDEDLKDRV